MNNSSNSFDFGTITPNDVDEYASIPTLDVLNENTTMVLVNDQFIAPKLHNHQKPKQSISGIVISILLVLNIVAITLYYFRNDILNSTIFTAAPNLPSTEIDAIKTVKPQNDQDVKDYSSIVSDVLTDLAIVEKTTQKSRASKTSKLNKLFTQSNKQSAKKPIKSDRKKRVKPTSNNPSKIVSANISGSDIRNILDKYVENYSKGNIPEVLRLFETNKSSSVSLTQIRNNIKSVFTHSKSRQVNIDNMVWQYQDEKAVGRGKYRATVELTNNDGQQSIDADVTITVQKEANQVYISTLLLANAKTSVSTQNFPSLPLDPTTSYAIAPSRVELQNLLTQYIGAFESGDIEWIISLFAIDAVTNKRIGMEEIAQDYETLFQVTTNRSIFLKDLSWTYSKNHAKGSGKLNVFVTNKDGEIDHIIGGKIKIIAKRVKNSVVITHFYHSEGK